MAGGGFRKRPGNKVVPYFSHEFVIQNHGDIVTCMCMVFIVGLMFQVINTNHFIYILLHTNTYFY
jgi:translocating chain-associated membrane protein 1